ncbi:hypothetical protein Sxan_03200 [Streptomyces xanthophaeus]|uniref:Uncharacterized protein n=1 Tax=Streptomyces xanthophaeus TaxID=67385 RepID=A0A919LB44_9ACTN|nr:hypothetical protein Sxan_03200 [Streptomyces xanthophaeus]
MIGLGSAAAAAAGTASVPIRAAAAGRTGMKRCMTHSRAKAHFSELRTIHPHSTSAHHRAAATPIRHRPTGAERHPRGPDPQPAHKPLLHLPTV